MVGTALNLEEKVKIYPQVLTFFIKAQIVVLLQTTAKKWTKVKNARASACKVIVFPPKICKFVTFSLPLPLSLLELPIVLLKRPTNYG